MEPHINPAHAMQSQHYSTLRVSKYRHHQMLANRPWKPVEGRFP